MRSSATAIDGGGAASDARPRRRARKRSFGSSGSNSIDTGAATVRTCPQAVASPAARRRIAPWSSPTGRSSRQLADGRIGIDPYDESLLQPSSVDVRVDRYFRVFHNSRYPFIDVKQPQEELTELVEIEDETPFILHPGEFVLGSTLERIRLPDDLVARLEGKSSLGTARTPDPLDRRLHRSRLGRSRHARAVERGKPPDHDLPRDEDRPGLVRPDERAAAEKPYGSGGLGSKYQGQKGPTPCRYWRNFER